MVHYFILHSIFKASRGPPSYLTYQESCEQSISISVYTSVWHILLRSVVIACTKCDMSNQAKVRHWGKKSRSPVQIISVPCKLWGCVLRVDLMQHGQTLYCIVSWAVYTFDKFFRLIGYFLPVWSLEFEFSSFDSLHNLCCSVIAAAALERHFARQHRVLQTNGNTSHHKQLLFWQVNLGCCAQ